MSAPQEQPVGLKQAEANYGICWHQGDQIGLIQGHQGRRAGILEEVSGKPGSGDRVGVSGEHRACLGWLGARERGPGGGGGQETGETGQGTSSRERLPR